MGIGKGYADITPYETQAQYNWFATAAGTGGDGTSWDTACTFREAVAKCSDGVQDTIWLSPEDHECDNEEDANGTTISAKNVRVVGVSTNHSFNARLYNTAASVDYVVQVTGHRVAFENIRFNQMGQTDLDVVLLHISAPRTNIVLCQFRGVSGSSSDVGVLIDNTSRYHYFDHVHFQDFQDAAIRTNDVNNSEFENLHIRACTTGIDFTHADDEDLDFTNVELIENTTGIILAGGVNEIRFTNTTLVHNTTNIVDGGTYDGLHMINAQTAHGANCTYPANAGVAIASAGGGWAQGSLTQIIPASTLTTPFKITGFNIQSCDANNTYKLELFYGAATGDHSLGIYEFLDVGGNKFNPPPVVIGPLFVPSNSYIGAKLASSSGGDTATITLNYQVL